MKDGHLWDRKLGVLERCPSLEESNEGSKENKGPTLAVRLQSTVIFTVRCPVSTSSVTLSWPP